MREIRERGITLIALVITIVVLLILAGITIGAITGDNGIINKTGQAKEDTEIANEKEIIDTSTVEAMGKNKRGNLEEDEFQSAIDKHTDGKVEVTDIGEEFEVYFTETNRYYMVDKDGNIGEAQEAVKDKYPGDITVGENGEQLDGSEEHPYEINCIEDLVAFSNMQNEKGKVFEDGKLIEAIDAKKIVNGSIIILTRNLNFKSKTSYENSERIDFGDVNEDGSNGKTLFEEMTDETGSGFPAINGTFSGIFDGKGYSISNIFEKNRTPGKILGLFGDIKGNGSITIQNLTVEGKIDNQLEDSNQYSSTGGIIGCCSQDTKIYNCKSNVEIFSNGHGSAGIIANSLGKNTEIINCANFGIINNLFEYTGGIVGIMETQNGTIKNCYNLGNILSTGSVAGGILGLAYTGNISVENVYNIGEITKTGPFGRGGIIGRQLNASCSINNAYNMGLINEQAINWTYSAGAIVGRTENVNLLNIQNCFYLKNTCSKKVGNTSEEFIEITALDNIENELIVEQFNSYIDTNNLENQGWKKWKLGEDGYPTFE